MTDMLYIASGSGIAPVLDQVKAVRLPSGSSSVKSVTVIWVNDKEEDFDVALSSLEMGSKARCLGCPIPNWSAILLPRPFGRLGGLLDVTAGEEQVCPQSCLALFGDGEQGS